MERYDDEYRRRWGRSDRGGISREFAAYHAFGGRVRGNRGTPELDYSGSGYPAGGGSQREARRNYRGEPLGHMDDWRDVEPRRGFGRYDTEAGYRGRGYDAEFRRERRWW